MSIKEFDKAKECLARALAVEAEIGNVRNQAEITQYLGDYHLVINNKEKAKQYYLAAYEYAIKTSANPIINSLKVKISNKT